MMNEESEQKRLSIKEKGGWYVVVWKDGTFLVVDGRGRANEYEQDEDWLTTFSLSDIVASALWTATQ